MNIGKFDLFYSNRQHTHPTLGLLDCNALKSSYNECLTLMGISQSQVYCIELFELTNKCYKCKDEMEFNGWVDERLEQRRRLMEHLRGRGSVVPGLIGKYNAWGMFGEREGKGVGRDAMEVGEERFVENVRTILELDRQKE